MYKNISYAGGLFLLCTIPIVVTSYAAPATDSFVRMPTFAREYTLEPMINVSIIPSERDGGDRNDTILINRLAQGILHIKQDYEQSWYSCGKSLALEEQDDAAYTIAHALVEESRRIMSDVSPWGILGTMYNESHFDTCALGFRPRMWAYRVGLLKKRKTALTHSRNAVQMVITNPWAKQRFASTGFDLGLCQILTQYYPGKQDVLLSTYDGVRLCVSAMSDRAKYSRNKPWTRWRSWKPNKKYVARVRRWAKIMGATQIELSQI